MIHPTYEKFRRGVLFLAFVMTMTLAVAAFAQGKTKRPDDKEIEAALRTVVQLTLSQDPNDPGRVANATAVAALVSALAGDKPDGFDQTQSRLEKKGIRVTEALGAILDNMKNVQCRSVQSEAKTNLKALYVAQEMFRGENDTYDTSQKKLGFSPKGSSRYRYEVVFATETSFKARATGLQGPVKGDVWEITEKRDLHNVTPRCAGR